MSNESTSILPFNPYPVFITTRLRLRKLGARDKSAIFALRSDEEVRRYLNRPLFTEQKQAVEFVDFICSGIEKEQWWYWAITLGEEDELIGTICLWNIAADQSSAEIGFELLPDYQRKGIMNEALTAIIQFAFSQCQFSKIEGTTNSQNIPSIKLLERHGFRRLPKTADEETADGTIISLYSLVLINQEI